MCVIHHIRKHIFGLQLDEICFTRDFLQYGQRTTIDTSLWRLVGRGMLLRVADGVCVREGSRIPTLEEIVRGKAARFGREVVEFCGQFAAELNIEGEDRGSDDRGSDDGDSDDRESDDHEPQVFGTDGQTSSFDTIHARVKLVRVAGRKRSMGESKPAKAARSLWYMKTPDLRRTASALSILNRDERQNLRALICWMPAWLSNQFVRMVRRKKVIEPNSPV